MPETPQLHVDELKGAIGSFLGFGRGDSSFFGETAWTTRQTNDIKAVLKAGLGLVHTPPVLQNQAPHNWSFLRPVASITLDSGESEALLPVEFNGFEGDLYVTTPGTAARGWPIRLVHEGVLQSEYARNPETTGSPKYACERVAAAATFNGSARSSLWVWPVADAAYTFSATYKYVPGVLDGSYPYPPGGAEHAELYRAACLAAAELHLDNERGPMWASFVERLSASIAADSKRKGRWIGYNGDRSDFRGRNSAWDRRGHYWDGYPEITLADGTEFS